MIHRFMQIARKFRNRNGVRPQHAVVTPLSEPFELAARLATVILEQPKGFTWCPRSMSLVTAKNDDEYCVSRDGYEKRLRCMPPDRLDLVDWIVKASERLRFHGEFIGGWRDHNGIYSLDVTVVVRGLGPAVEFGLANQQKSIYQLRSGKYVGLALYRKTVESFPTD